MTKLINKVFQEELTEQGLTELKTKYPSNLVLDMSDDAEFKKARKIRTERNKLVESINRRRIDVTAELKSHGDSLVEQVNDIYDVVISPFEIEDQRRKDEAEKKRLAHEKLLNEERDRINNIRTMANSCRNKNSQSISYTIEAIDLIEVDCFHKDVIHEAMAAKKESLEMLSQLLSDTVAREKVEAERAELEKLRAELAAQKPVQETAPQQNEQPQSVQNSEPATYMAAPAKTSVQFEDMQLREHANSRDDQEALRFFFGEEDIFNLGHGENGLEYNLEVIVRRVSIKHKAAA